MIYPAFMKIIHPKNSNSIREFNYLKKDKKFIRVTKKMKTCRKVRWMSKTIAEDFMPEYFI